MKQQFWHDKWQNNEIGFDQAAVNPHLLRYWGALDAPAGAEVFVPMCGKSIDMLWLREQGFTVVGVELSELAVKAFFAENNLPVTVSQAGCYRSTGITIYCGDFFKLTAEHLHNTRAVYDRASLVALPPEMRRTYVRHMLECVPAGASMLQITMEYDQREMAGPPFSVTEAEVHEHYGENFSIRRLYAEDILDGSPVFIEQGLSRLQEKSYLLTPR